jgi:integrase
MKLNHKQCDTAKPKEKPYKLSDGGGMYLEIMPNGSKYWRLKYRMHDKEKRLALGVFPETSLVEAREQRDLARKLIKAGEDPGLAKKQQKLQAKISADNTFEVIAREWHEHNKARWTSSYGKDILHRLGADIFPTLGAYPITAITPPLILQTVRLIESRGAHEMARRSMQYCGQIFRYAIGEGKAESDPTRDLKGQLKPFKKGHYAALEGKDLPDFLKALERNDARLYAHTRRALKLMLLTFVRTGELINAKWDEFDLEQGVWIIPGARMKMGKDHVVPLARQALALLREQKEDTGGWEWVFPNQVRPKKAMSNNTILKALERMGYKGVMTGHGFRALARTVIREKLDWDSEIIEKQLAHKTRETLGEAYDRTQFLPQRVKMMQDWAAYLDGLASGGQVIPHNFKKQQA